MKLPDGYESVEFEGGEGFALAGFHDSVAEILQGGTTLYDWARKREDRHEFQGRGPVYDVPAPEGDARWVARHYRRGGWMRFILGDRFLRRGIRRPELELTANSEVLRRGLLTPRVVAGAVYDAGRIFYRADIVTERVMDGQDLADVVFGDSDSAWAEETLTATGRFLVRLENAGIVHPDLNARNLLVRRQDGAPEIHLLDLDRCSGLPDGKTATRGPMRSRLRRSLEKIATDHDRELSQAEIVALARGLEHG